MMLTLTARAREHRESEKVRKAIAKNGDKAAENHASQKKAGLAFKSEVEGMEKRQSRKGKKTDVNFL
jgi:hypothetical protein